MYRIVVLLVPALVLAGGCGSGGGTRSTHPHETPSASASPSASPSAKAAYFKRVDTDAINKAAAAAQRAGAKAQAARNLRKCNGARNDYAAWRSCWHGLLDSFESALHELSTTMTSLAAKDLPQDCVARLSDASNTFAGYAEKVAGLSDGIDSDRRAQQARSMHDYTGTLKEISEGYTKPFQELTQVCYSPKDLASINASPNAQP